MTVAKGNNKKDDLDQTEEVFVFPASYGQKRMWFLDRFEPNSPYYNIPIAFKIKGKFEQNLFLKTIEYIIKRHESIRTTFKVINGEPHQIISPELCIEIPIIDIEDTPPSEKENTISNIIRKEARLPFNLEIGPLFRVKVFKLSEDEHVISITIHHIISDGWSMGILVEEITEIYSSLLTNKKIHLPELEIQYADYSEWQNEYLSGEILQKQLSYWKNKLGDSNSLLELPTDRSRQSVYTNNGASLERVLPTELVDKIQRLTNSENATLFMTLVAAFNVMLYRYTGQSDINIGTPIANRTDKAIERIIGLFINTLVLRTDMSNNPTFRELLKAVRKTNLEAFEHQDLPFEMLVDAIQPERNMSYAPLFQVMLILQNNPVRTTILPEIEISMINVDMGTATSDITYSVSVGPNGALCLIEYNTDLFNKSTMQRMFDDFEYLLNEIVDNPGQKISQYKILSNESEKLVLEEWNSRKKIYPAINGIHSLVEMWADRTPNAVAVVDDNTRITYQQLNEKSNQLAHYLLQLNSANDVPIGISQDKTTKLLISVIGVLKAGYAYLPIDPSYPKDRLEYMLNDSSIEYLLTDKNNSDLFDEFTNKIIIDDLLNKENYLKSNPDIRINNNDLAYIIYTSGSTGKAKGAMISHASLINIYFGWEIDYGLLEEVNNHLQMASFSFDVFGGDWTRALCSGGKLVLVSREKLLDAEKLFGLIIKEEIDIAEFVPAVLRNLIIYLDANNYDLYNFKVLIAGSDIWYVKEYKDLRKYVSSETRLINSFGLTETAIDSTYFEDKNLYLPDERLVPIGKPFPNIQIYIVDVYLNILPIGAKGELYIGGISIARGYYNNPSLTAEKFIPNPFSNNLGERIYRTGDIARFLPDGNIEFLGRSDHQIKLRGFRIELGEIENALSDHEYVQESIVVLHENESGDKKLIAYLVCSDGATDEISDIREFISKKVPDYMIPSAFIMLEKFPLTPNGKIDRKSLPEPGKIEFEVSAEEEFIEPRNEVELKLVDIWKDVLSLERIGVANNFFILGGHSLLATQVVSRIKKELKVDLPLRLMFEKPTVSDLAEEVERLKSISSQFTDVIIAKRETNKDIPLSFAQERLWFLDQLQPNNPFYNIPETYRIRGDINLSILEKCINDIIKRHEIFRTYFVSVDGTPQQKIQDTLTINIPIIDLSNEPVVKKNSLSKKYIDIESKQSISIYNLPLFRIKILKLENDDHIFLMTIHHIISDDWSSRIIIREIGLLYDNYSRGGNNQLPELSIQYADYSIWQREWLQGDLVENQISYWKKQLSGLPPSLELPTDFARPQTQTYNGDVKLFELSEEVSQKLKLICKEEGLTAFMMLMAIFKLLLCKLSGQNDICIGTPSANRNNVQIESLVGFFVNTLAIRTILSPDTNFIDFTKTVKESTLGAFANQDLPFEYIVDAINPERNLNHSPIFQVMFVYQNVDNQTQDNNSDLIIFPIQSHSKTAKFDLTLFTLDSGDKIGGAFEFNTDLFTEKTINSFIEYFKNIIDTAVNNKFFAIDSFTLISEKEQRSIISQLNKNDEFPNNFDFVHLEFSKTAQMNLSKSAIESDGKEITFGNLESVSNQIAHYLLRIGIQRESIVGVCLQRSYHLISSLLGILKAGAAYLPIDPSFPKERMEYIIKDSDPDIIITDSNYSELFQGAKTSIINLDEKLDEINTHSSDFPEISLSKDNICYVIYTSGSTGRPKGTLLTHKGLSNYLSWTLFAYPFNRDNGSLVHSTLAFDATVTSIFPSLLAGKRIVLMSENEEIDALAKEVVQHERFSVLKLTPAHLELLSNLVDPSKASEISDAMILGGENLTYSHIEYWQENSPSTLIFNEYGPTEAVVGCVVFEGSKTKGSASVPIGRVIPNVEIYVLDKNYSQVPIGVQGELYIGGIGLARGYLNRPDLTAEKFIPNSFSALPGERIYKTGDLVRIQKDGNLMYLGRIDEQVKIRGYRIELDEVRSVLNTHLNVKDSVVLVKEIKPNVKTLLAYILSDKNIPDIELDLIEHVNNYLPVYMIPNQFIQIEDIPLTINGKVDKKKLLDIEYRLDEKDKEFVKPRNDHEEILVKIWRDVLGIEKISVTDNFFQLGGDSILSIQIIARANKAGLGLLPRHIFEYPTIERLANKIDHKLIVVSDQGVITGELKSVPIFEWFFEQNLSEKHHYNQSIIIGLKENITEEILINITLEMMRHHDIFRLRVNEINNSRIFNIIDMEESMPVHYYDFSSIEEELLLPKIEETAKKLQASLNIFEGPVFKVAFFYTGEESVNYLLVIFHHLVIDGVSWRIVLEDFNSSLFQIKSGDQISLPPKSTSFKYWTEKMTELANSGKFNEEIEFWSETAKKKIVHFSPDFTSDDNSEGATQTISIELNAELTSALIHDINVVYKTTIMDILITSLALSVGEMCDNTEIMFEMESHGRNNIVEGIDLSRTVGWFTSIYPVGISINKKINLDATIKSVKNQLNEIPNFGLGYGILRYLSVDEEIRNKLRYETRPEILFNYLGQFNSNEGEDNVEALRGLKGSERSQSQVRSHLIDINCGIYGGILRFEFCYSKNIFKKESIEIFANLYIQYLEKIIIHCQNVGVDSFDENDFKQFGWEQQDIDDIINEIDNVN